MNALPDLIIGKIVLITAPRAAQEVLLELAAGLARRGPVRVLDGGNQFNAYHLARTLRRYTPQIEAALSRVSLARAFTCYQMEALLATCPIQAAPTLVLDFPATFYDESVSLVERKRLMEHCVGHLRRLSGRAPVAVGARLVPPNQPERTALFSILRCAADQLWEVEAPALPAPPPTLF